MHFAHKAAAALAALTALGSAAHPALAQAPAYTFTTLNDPLAGTYTDPYGTLSGTVAAGINASGQIVGYYYDSTGSHAFLDTPGTGFTTLAVPAGDTGTGALGINSAGQIVGGYSDSAGSHGFIDTPGVGFTQIDDPSAGATGTTFVSGISDSGQIVGNYIDSSGSFRLHGFVGTPGTSGGPYTFADVLDPSATSGTTARGINGSGQIAGNYTIGGFQYGFLETPGGGYVTLSDPSGAKHTNGTGVNDSGQVAGYYLDNKGTHGFVETPGTGGAAATFATLDDPLGASRSTFVQGINNLGQVVGYYTDANGVNHGFLASPAAVPEASSVASLALLLLLGAGGLGLASRKRTRAAV